MDWLTFIATMTGHIMWPIVIIVLLFLLRKHIGALAERIEEFSFGGAKFVWKKKLAEGATLIEHQPQPELNPSLGPPPPNKKRAPSNKVTSESNDAKREGIAEGFARRREMRRQLLLRSAFGKVLTGLDEVERTLFEIADRMGLDPASASSVMYSLVANGDVPPSIGKLYDTLRDARNLIAHSPSLPDEKEANEYVRQTQFLMTALEHLKTMPTQTEREAFK
ncbi:hypothetical protein [Bradyrhizobium sp. HKCCYLR20261]|uniref:hypothetical protein n=1 Tax=Bradyrhizobium sp. HKCCYLR20261 TaxID=3420760 RepID=UPI003EBC02F0